MARTRTKRALSLVLATLAWLLVVLALLVSAGAWLLRSDDGLQWLLSRVPGLAVTGLFGRPDGGPMEATRVEWRSGGMRVVVDGLAWRDARWRWRPYEGAWVGIELDAPRARRVEVITGPSSGAAPATSPPQQLRLPLEIVLRALSVDTLQVNALPALHGLSADAHLGADQGAVHDVQHLAMRTPQADVVLQGRIGTDAPFPATAQIGLAAPATASRAWQASVKADGPLARLAIDAKLQAGPGAQAEGRATIAPFAAWPLVALEAGTHDLDLAALSPGWPATRLTGRAVAHTSGLDEPARIEVELANALPGAWNEARVPLREAHAVLLGTPGRRDRIELGTFELQLGGARPAGRLTGSGHWQGERLELALAVDGLQPRSLDARLAAMTLDGPVTLDLRGLPPLGGGARSEPHWAGALTATLAGRLAQPRGAPPLRLAGQLAFEAPAGALDVSIGRLHASAGPARADATATLARNAAGRWRVDSRGTLAQFDPAPWWPAAAAIRPKGATTLNARWDVALAWAAGALAPLGPDTPGRLDGRAALALDRSTLAGVPLEGTASLSANGRGIASVDADLRVSANRLQVTGRATPAGRDDRWQLQVDAPALDAFAPLDTLVPDAARAWWPRSGAVAGRAVAAGRWPALRTEGDLLATNVRAGTFQAARLAARWTAPGTLDAAAPISITLEGASLALGDRRIERLDGALTGTPAAHRITLSAATSLRPPAWADPLLGPAPAAPATAAPGTTLALAGEGQWRRDGNGSTWQGTLQRLQVSPRTGTAAPWIAAQDLQGRVRLDAAGRPLEAQAAPGRVELLGAALRWRQASWRGGAAPRIELDAELEPLAVAPWLARLQPSFGWGGDLAIAGRFVVSQGERLSADIVVERSRGDLSITQDGGTQSLGLTDLRLALAAHDGTWHLTQALAGTNVGVLGGAQSVRTDPRAAWPPPDTPLEGVVELRVAHLGVWTTWLPPGWRLGGQLRTSASLGGTFGAPEYTGEIVGSGLEVRNLLEGVDVRDGELAVALRGADARVERFVLHGGEGELRLTGGASFGAAPSTQLHVEARRFRVLGRVDRRIVVSGDADLGVQAQQLSLQGRVVVDEGLIDISRADAPSLDADVSVRRRPGAPGEPASAARRDAPAAEGPLRQATVALVVSLGEKLRLRGRGLDATLAGELSLSAPNGRLAVDGTVRAENGTYAAYGQKLDIERGAIIFTGAVENPRLDILAVRPNLDVRVGVAVSGGVLTPRVRLYSEPEMSELDKLSWLVVGRASEGLGGADTAVLQRAAVALLAGEGGGSTDAVLKNIGLDELSVRQTEDGTVRDTVVTVGKQLSQRWYVGYERSVNATTGTWQLIYRVARRFTLRAQTGEDNALDVIWTWRWN